MVDTIKFSQMADGGDINNNDKVPGLLAGNNVLFNNPWVFLPPGTTSERPAPSPAINYRLRLNTDTDLYEYYNAIGGVWVELSESTISNGPFVTYTSDATLPDAQNLGLLSDGILKQTIVFDEANIGIAVNGTDFYGPGFTGYFQSPEGVKDINGDIIVKFITLGMGVTSYLQLENSVVNPAISVGSSNANADLYIRGKGATGATSVISDGPVPLRLRPNASIFRIDFNVPSLATDRVVTFPDASGTVAFVNSSAQTFNGNSGSATPAAGVITFTGGTTGLTFTGSGSTMTLSGNMTNGQLIIGSTSGTPMPATLTSGTGISITNAANSITVASTGGGMSTIEVTGTSQLMVPDTRYVTNNGGSTVTLTLPVTAAFGTAISIIGKGAIGWIVAQNLGQSIRISGSTTTVGSGGGLASSSPGDSINLICTTANTVWTACGGPQGNITIF